MPTTITRTHVMPTFGVPYAAVQPHDQVVEGKPFTTWHVTCDICDESFESRDPQSAQASYANHFVAMAALEAGWNAQRCTLSCGHRVTFAITEGKVPFRNGDKVNCGIHGGVRAIRATHTIVPTLAQMRAHLAAEHDVQSSIYLEVSEAQEAHEALHVATKTCKTCGKAIVPTPDDLTRQSAWRHADGTGAGVGTTVGVKAQWCETGDGYVKVEPGTPAHPSFATDIEDAKVAAGNLKAALDRVVDGLKAQGDIGGAIQVALSADRVGFEVAQALKALNR